MRSLNVYLYDKLVGHLIETPDRKIDLVYDQGWIASAANGYGHALSLSLPLDQRSDPLRASTFIAGLLPDSPLHRNVLALQFGIEDDPSDFNFIKLLGRECAGAITITSAQELNPIQPGYRVLSELELTTFLRELPRRPLMLDQEDGVMLSLAGVNSKAAVLVSKSGRVAIPRGGRPSTHIIKMDIPGLPDSIRAEAFCLSLARAVGHTVPACRIRTSDNITYLLMQRYDRAARSQPSGKLDIYRLHQEDFCQAMGYSPDKKYERHGGPSWRQSFALIQKTANPIASSLALMDRCAFQYIIGNPDAHAKNYSLLYETSGAVSLAPFYDLNNAAAYKAFFKSAKPLMAMSIGGEFYRPKITLDHWKRHADLCDLPERQVMESLERQADAILGTLPALRRELKGTIEDAAILDLIEQDVSECATTVLDVLHVQSPSSTPSFNP
jgi:serine/threonine-protein kinase HipA